MSSNSDKLTAWFRRFDHRMNVLAPQIVAETAVQYYKESFTKKAWNGIAWKETKQPVKKGSLMVRSGALMATVRPATISSSLVRISAGSSKVPYAKIHNEGAEINRSARSETFVRGRQTKGNKRGQFKRGTTSGEGFTFKSYKYNMPKRQFMGHTAELNKRIITRLKSTFNT